VTEPELPPIEGSQLRAFPDALPADELNTTIDESFVPMATNALPGTVDEFHTWRADRVAGLRRLVFRPLPDGHEPGRRVALGGDPQAGSLVTEPGVTAFWRYFPPSSGAVDTTRWLVVLGETESLEHKPDWLRRMASEAGVLLVAPRGTGPTRWQDPAPFYIQRSLALLGRTVEGDRVHDVLAVAASFLPATEPGAASGGASLAGADRGHRCLRGTV